MDQTIETCRGAAWGGVVLAVLAGAGTALDWWWEDSHGPPQDSPFAILTWFGVALVAVCWGAWGNAARATRRPSRGTMALAIALAVLALIGAIPLMVARAYYGMAG